MKFSVSFATLVLLVSTSDVNAAEIAGEMVVFQSGTPALASEVNSNFSKLASAIDGLQAKLAAVEEENTLLREQLANVLALNEYVAVDTLHEQPVVRLSGVNLQLVNGLGSTDTINGTGNFLVGYDEGYGQTTCSIGTDSYGRWISNSDTCVAEGGVWSNSHKNGSHNVVVGTKHNYSSVGGLVAGYGNTINAKWATVSGGIYNWASGNYATVSGGEYNLAPGATSSVVGGSDNRASGQGATISGGSYNTASGIKASVSGGSWNSASGAHSNVSGGYQRSAAGQYDWAAGTLLEDL